MANINVYGNRNRINFAVFRDAVSIYVTCKKVMQSLKNTALGYVLVTPSSFITD